MPEPKVIVGDNQPIRREAVAGLMRRRCGISDVVTCTTAQELAAMGRSLEPAAVVVAPSLCSSAQALRDLVSAFDPARVVVYPTEGDSLTELGDVDVVPGTVSPADLARHVRNRVPAGASQQPALTRRELAVLRSMCSDDPAKTACLDLAMSEATFKTHQRSIFRKLGVHTRPAAVHRGMVLGLIDHLGILPLGFIGDWLDAVTSILPS